MTGSAGTADASSMRTKALAGSFLLTSILLTFSHSLARGWSSESFSIKVTAGMSHADAIRRCAAAAGATVVCEPEFEHIRFNQTFRINDVDPLDMACMFAWEPGFALRNKARTAQGVRYSDEKLSAVAVSRRPYSGQEWSVVRSNGSDSMGRHTQTSAHAKYLKALSPFPGGWIGTTRSEAILRELQDQPE